MANDPRDNFRTKELAEVRKRIASFINADEDEIALTYATTDGVNIFAVGLDWREGDEVIICRHEHFDPFAAYEGLAKRYGIKIVWVDTPSPPQNEDELVSIYEKAMTPRTRVIFVSQVTFITGLQMPIKKLTELAHRHGALISVDGVQATGALRINVRETDIDHFASGAQKWLLAGTGTGFTYIRKDLQPKIWPRNGYVADETSRNASARRYENTGQRNIPAYMGLAAAVELIETIGIDNVEARVRQLADRLRNGLRELAGVKLWTSTKPELSAGLTTFGIDNYEPKEILQALEKEKITGRPVNEPDVVGVRMSTHIYNSPDEIDRVIATLKKLC
jgi:selenocysteine lyase/cysteine desulfurase